MKRMLALCIRLDRGDFYLDDTKILFPCSNRNGNGTAGRVIKTRIFTSLSILSKRNHTSNQMKIAMISRVQGAISFFIAPLLFFYALKIHYFSFKNDFF